MNGRIYSPSIGRMLSPDPVTQEPENGQNYNRYTYAFNNPLKYTDPSGYTAELGPGTDFDFFLHPSSSRGVFTGEFERPLAYEAQDEYRAQALARIVSRLLDDSGEQQEGDIVAADGAGIIDLSASANQLHRTAARIKTEFLNDDGIVFVTSDAKKALRAYLPITVYQEISKIEEFNGAQLDFALEIAILGSVSDYDIPLFARRSPRALGRWLTQFWRDYDLDDFKDDLDDGFDDPDPTAQEGVSTAARNLAPEGIAAYFKGLSE